MHDEPEVPAGDRIDAERRLVQQHDVWFVDQGAAQPELLLHPPRQITGKAMLERPKTGEGVQSLEAGSAVSREDQEQIGVELDVLSDR